MLGIQQRDSEGDSGSQGNDTQQEFQTYIAVYTLKKKDCLFNINLLAPSKKIFQEEDAVFQDFIQGFNSLRIGLIVGLKNINRIKNRFNSLG